MYVANQCDPNFIFESFVISEEIQSKLVTPNKPVLGSIASGICAEFGLPVEKAN